MTTANHNSQRSSAGSARKALVALLSFALVVQPAYAGTLVFKHDVQGFQGAPVPWTNDGSGNPPPPPPPESQQPAALQFTTPQVDFGQVTAGQNRQASAVLRNTGGLPATGVTVSVPAGSFSASSNCSTTLAAGAQCTVQVEFTASTVGSQSATVSATASGTQALLPLSAQVVAAPAASLQAAPASLNFATTATGQTTVGSVVITNSGNASAQTSISVAVGEADFGQDNDCGTVAAGASCTVNVAFTPSTAGQKTGTVAVVYGSQTLTIALAGAGQAPSASLSDVDFGSHAANSPTDLTSTLANTGVGPLSLTAPGAGSVSGAGFSFVSTTCGASLAAGATCTVTTRFTPTSNSAFSGTLSVVTAAGTQTATLSGQGLQGLASVNLTSLTFASTQVAQTSATQAVTVTNNGTAPLSITGVSVSTGASDFAQSNNCGASLAIGNSCTVNVSFTPALSGARNGTLSLTHDGTGEITSVSLTGTGVGQTATLGDVAFGNRAVGSTSDVTSTLTNTGIGPLAVTIPTSGSVTGTGFSFVSTTCGTSVAAGGSCTVTARFSPTGNSAYSGSVSVGTGAGTKTAALSGQGQQAVLGFTPATLGAFANTEVGQTTDSAVVTLSNSGNVAATSMTWTVPAGYSIVNSNCGGPLNAGSSCTFRVRFAPMAAQLYSGSVSVTAAAPATGASLAVSGTGDAPAPALTPVIASNDLNGVTVGTTSTGEAWVRFENLGAESVEYQGVTAQAPLFVSDAFCSPGDWLATGENCTVILKVTPTSAGSFTRNVTVQTNKGSVSIAVPFTAQ